MPDLISHAEMIAAVTEAIVDYEDTDSAAPREIARRLRAVLLHLERTQWRPIEEAPKDGSAVLVYRPRGRKNGTYIGRIGVDAFGTVAGHPNAWANSSQDAPPSRFMPLPPSPETPR